MSPVFDKSKCYGMAFINGVEYEYLLPVWQRPMYKLTVMFQYMLWRIGIPWHNWFADECTPNFNCCIHKCTEEEKAILSAIADSSDPIIAYYNERTPRRK